MFYYTLFLLYSSQKILKKIKKIKSEHKTVISIIKKVAKKNNTMKVTKKPRRKWFKIHKEKKI